MKFYLKIREKCYGFCDKLLKTNGNGMSTAVAKLYVSLLHVRKEYGLRSGMSRARGSIAAWVDETVRWSHRNHVVSECNEICGTHVMNCPRLLKRAEYQGTKYLYRKAHKRRASVCTSVCTPLKIYEFVDAHERRTYSLTSKVSSRL